MRNILEIKKTCLAGMSQEEIKAYLEDKGYEWEDWYFDTVFTPGEIVENLQFWKASSEYVSDIRPEVVIGHNHGSISNSYNWITHLSCLKRWNYDTDAEAILKMLKEQHNLPSGSLIHLEKYGNYYFFSEGRHRMVQAKILKLETLHCGVTEYVFDQHAYDLFCRIQGKATIEEKDCWKLGLPIKAKLFNLSFIIPLTDNAVGFFERVIQKAQKISRIPVYWRLYALYSGYREDYGQCFNLNYTESPEKTISALCFCYKKAGTLVSINR